MQIKTCVAGIFLDPDQELREPGQREKKHQGYAEQLYAGTVPEHFFF